MSKIAILRKALLELLREHERDDMLPTNARFLFYELIARGVVSKEKTGARRPDQDANDALTDLRESEQIPWHWIVDETRTLNDYSGYPSIKKGVLDYLSGITLDPWRGRTLLVLAESRSLAGTLRPIAQRYRVRIASTNGQCGGFLHTKIEPLLDNASLYAAIRRRPKPQVLYLGDYDLAGNQIEANTRRVLEQEICDGLDWERVALTAEQVEQHDLPTIEKHDRRYKDGRPHEAVETEPLGQKLVSDLLERELIALLPEPLENVREREKRQQQTVRKKIA
jgi:hypothetical protein